MGEEAPACEDCETPLCTADGRTHVYGETDDECERFADEAAARDVAITTLASTPDGTDARCYRGLAVFFCAQQPLHRAVGSARSACSLHRRPYAGDVHDCLKFCPVLEEDCARAPNYPAGYCMEQCRLVHAGGLCGLLRVEGVPSSLSPRVRDVNNRYRLETEVDVPLLYNHRPKYRSVPASRSGGSDYSGVKRDYYLYFTEANGFGEWLIDPDDEARSRAARARQRPTRRAECATLTCAGTERRRGVRRIVCVASG